MSGFNPAYLEAKKRIDSRSRNERVWNRFMQELAEGFKPKSILDLGAGNGAFLELLLAKTTLENFDYIPLDADQGLLQGLRESQDQSLLKERNIRIHPVVNRLESFLEQNCPQYDLVLTNAFLDLVNLDAIGDSLFDLVRGGGLFYSTLLFDGVTTFLPVLDPALDARVEQIYHASMVQAGKIGHRAGRILLASLLESPLEILDAGPSDWVILPRNGTYTEAERALLTAILDFHRQVLEQPMTGIENDGALKEWLGKRKVQIDEGKLALLTHQWDVLAKK